MVNCFAAIAVFVLLACLPHGVLSQLFGPGKIEQETLVHQDHERSYLMYIPQSWTDSKADEKKQSRAPLVVALHPYSSLPAHMAEVTYLNTVAEEQRFIVVYPRGSIGDSKIEPRLSFNAGPKCCGGSPADKRDDVDFIREVIKAVRKSYSINAKRIYIIGFSNGGFMAHRCACDMSDVIAAFASVSAGSPWEVSDFMSNCHPTRPVPSFHLHATKDTRVPYADTRKTVDFWRQLNGCDTSEVGSLIFSHGTIQCNSWSQGCKVQDGGEPTNVTLCSVDGENHRVWPMSQFSRNKDMDTTRVIWKFLKRYSSNNS